MNVKVVYDNIKDKEFLDKISLETPIFVEYIDINSKSGKKDGWKIMNYYGTKKFPFIEITLEDNTEIPLYSERGNAVGQLINYLNNDCKN